MSSVSDISRAFLMAIAAWPATTVRNPTSSSLKRARVAGVNVDGTDYFTERKQRGREYGNETGFAREFGIAELLLRVDVRG